MVARTLRIGGVGVFLNDGDGRFIEGPSTRWYVEGGQRSVAIGDFDDDGDPDVALRKPEVFTGDVPSAVILWNDGSRLKRVADWRSSFQNNVVLAADFDGDGIDDLWSGGVGLSRPGPPVLR